MIVFPSMTGFIGGPKRDPRSVNFASASSQYLNMSDANFGSYTSAKFAISLWFNPNSLPGSNMALMAQQDTANFAFWLRINSSNKIEFYISSDGSSNDGILTTNINAQSSQWQHLMVHFDSANGTADNRMRMWVDGSEIVSFSSRTNPSSGVYNSTADITLARKGSAADYYDGKLYQVAFFDNSLPAITEVRNTSSPFAKDVAGVSVLNALLQPTATSIIDDSVLTPNWTNNNTATASTSVPT